MKPANSRPAPNLGGHPLLISALPAIPRPCPLLCTARQVRLASFYLLRDFFGFVCVAENTDNASPPAVTVPGGHTPSSGLAGLWQLFSAYPRCRLGDHSFLRQLPPAPSICPRAPFLLQFPFSSSLPHFEAVPPFGEFS